MASFKQLSKYNWQVVISLGYDENGKKQRVKKQGFKNKKEAERFVTETLDKKNKGHVTTTESSMLLKDFILKWFNEYRSVNLSINTRNDYNYRINKHIIPILGSYKLNELTTANVQDFYNCLISQKGMKPVSAKKVFDILNSCLKYAKKNKLIYDLPTDIEKQKIEKPQIQFWTKSEVDFYLNAIKDQYLFYPVFITILTGLRIAELCGLQWKDINFEKGTLEVNSQVIQDKMNKQVILTNILKTSTSHRTISLPQLLLDYLSNTKKARNATDLDFVVENRNGEMCTPRNISMEFTKSIRKYKLSKEEMLNKNKDVSNYMQLKQITFHGLRHTHATLLILNGENIKVVSDRLGHRDITITLNNYIHVMESMKEGTAKLLNNMFKSLNSII